MFALVVPTRFTAEVQGPSDALHPSADHHDSVAAGADLIAFTVFVFVGAGVMLRVLLPDERADASGERASAA